MCSLQEEKNPNTFTSCFITFSFCCFIEHTGNSSLSLAKVLFCVNVTMTLFYVLSSYEMHLYLKKDSHFHRNVLLLLVALCLLVSMYTQILCITICDGTSTPRIQRQDVRLLFLIYVDLTCNLTDCFFCMCFPDSLPTNNHTVRTHRNVYIFLQFYKRHITVISISGSLSNV